MAVEPLDDEAAAALNDAAAGGNKRATPVTRVRPGHADLAGALKYGFNDVANVLERASARETAARVAAVSPGVPARARHRAWSFTAEVGGVAVDPAKATGRATRPMPHRCAARTPSAEAAMIARIDEARSRATRSVASSRSSSTGCRSGSVVRPLGPPARWRAGRRRS
jgi:chorismate synthase